MITQKSQAKVFLFVFVLSLVICGSMTVINILPAQALWQEPQYSPPLDNDAGAPLNTGLSNQVKLGGLNVQNGITTTKICLGTTTPVCKGAWPTDGGGGGLWATSSDFNYYRSIYSNNYKFGYPGYVGNVGIGTISPVASLAIQGYDISWGVMPGQDDTVTANNRSILMGQQMRPDAFFGISLSGLLDSNNYNFSSGNDFITPSATKNLFINRPQGNSILFSMNGDSKQMILTPAGNLGVGTTNPGRKLSISDNDQNQLLLETTNSASYATARWKTPSRTYQWAVGGSNSSGSDAFYIYDETSSSARLWVDKTGNVGVNKNMAVGGNLQVNGGVVDTINILGMNDLHEGGQINLKDPGQTVIGQDRSWVLDNYDSDLRIMDGGVGGAITTSMRFFSDGTIMAYPAVGKYFYVKGSINGQSLCMNGICKSNWGSVATSSQWTSVIDGNRAGISYLAGDILTGNGKTFKAQNSTGVYENWLWPRWTDNATYLNFGAGGMFIRNNNSTNTMAITSAGNVGIGTTTPTAGKLVVTGGSLVVYPTSTSNVSITFNVATSSDNKIGAAISNAVGGSSNATTTLFIKPGGNGMVQFFDTASTNTVMIKGDLNVMGAIKTNETSGMTKTLRFRNASNTGICTTTVSNGLITASTCL